MKTAAIRVGLFLVVCAFMAGIAWLFGYNFDERGPGVALYAWITFMFASLAALFPFSD